MTCSQSHYCIRPDGHHGPHRRPGPGLTHEWWIGGGSGPVCPVNMTVPAEQCPECRAEIEAEEARLRAGGALRPGQVMPAHLRQLATVITLDRLPAPVMRGRHVHQCPSCYEDVPCEDACSCDSDIDRDDGMPRGHQVVCAACRNERTSNEPAKQEDSATPVREEACLPNYSEPSTTDNQSESCTNQRGTEKSAAKYSENYSEPVDLEPWRKQPCKVHIRCIRHDGHHGQHVDAQGQAWDYGACSLDPLVRECPQCRADEYPIGARTPPHRRQPTHQLSLFNFGG